MILWTPNGIQNYKYTCQGACKAGGYITTWVIQQGDVEIIQVVANGVVTGISFKVTCWTCGSVQTATLTQAAFVNYVNTNQTNPAGLSVIEKATYFGQVYAGG